MRVVPKESSFEYIKYQQVLLVYLVLSAKNSQSAHGPQISYFLQVKPISDTITER